MRTEEEELQCWIVSFGSETQGFGWKKEVSMDEKMSLMILVSGLSCVGGYSGIQWTPGFCISFAFRKLLSLLQSKGRGWRKAVWVKGHQLLDKPSRLLLIALGCQRAVWSQPFLGDGKTLAGTPLGITTEVLIIYHTLKMITAKSLSTGILTSQLPHGLG